MSGIQPESRHMLGVMLREMEQTIMPDLGSTHARTVAYLISQGLRNLLVREQDLPALDTALKRAEADMAASADGKPVGEVESRSAIRAECDFLDGLAAAVAAIQAPQRSAERSALLAVAPERLTDYFRRKLPQYKTLRVSGVKPVLSGFSKETILVDMEVDGAPMPVVMRRNVPHGAVVSTVIDEYPLVAALHRYGLPVPEPVLLETDRGEFGEAFAVTRRAPGAAATNSMAGLVAGPELKTAALELAGFLARLHQVDLGDLGLPTNFYNPALTTRDYLLREIAICERYYQNHALQPSATYIAALAWLRANVPQVEGPPRLVHGDAGLTNLMMDGETMSVMLDWELAHPGDPVEDMTYARKWIDQFMPWDEFVGHYRDHGGPEYHPEREKFYAMLSDLRVAAFSIRTRDMLRKTDHPELTQMYAAQHYYGYFIGNVGRRLLE